VIGPANNEEENMKLLGLRCVSFFSLLAFALCFASVSWAQSAADDFQICAACHTIGGGRLIGPDLAGVADNRSEAWLIEFIQSSQKLIQSGDADAVALFEEYNGMIMPDSSLSESRIKAMLGYIVEQESASTEPRVAATAPAQPAPVPSQPSAELIEQGRELFQGTLQFAEGGPTCNACHDVHNESVVGGGSLARELTTAYSTMSPEGVTAIITNAPFPVMQSAYAGQPITDQETAALVAFLWYVDEQHGNQERRDYGVELFSGGALGSALLFGVCGFLWRGRRKGSVNQSIFDRQKPSA